MGINNYLVMIIMTFPRMPPAQYNRAIFLCSIENPKPHDGAETFAGDSMPALRLMQSYAFVRDAMAVSVSSAHFLVGLQIEFC